MDPVFKALISRDRWTRFDVPWAGLTGWRRWGAGGVVAVVCGLGAGLVAEVAEYFDLYGWLFG
jgi:hypothetical protein